MNTQLFNDPMISGVDPMPAAVAKPRHDLLATGVHLSWPYSIGLGLTSNGAA